ncbi:hypothetical protein AAMO2058_000235900 [Amorphochlora amoebiformis]
MVGRSTPFLLGLVFMPFGFSRTLISSARTLRSYRSLEATTRALYMTLGKVRRGTSRMHPMLPALSLQGAARAAFMASLSVGVTGRAIFPQASATSKSCITPTWLKDLNESIETEKDDPASKFMTLTTLSTASGQAEPRGRTVVFRGFLGKGDGLALKVITDVRSEKIDEIRANNRAEICWYFKDTREQYRLRGSLDVISHDEKNSERLGWWQSQWKSLSPGMRQSYEWPAPGVLRSSADEDTADFLDPSPSESPSPNYCLLLLRVECVDYLNLRSKPQIRKVHEVSSEGAKWTVKRVNP